jgi:hypothetical protein
MCAIPADRKALLDDLGAELAEAAYPVVLRHGARGSSVDVELDVWRAIRRVLRTTDREAPDLLAELASAVYGVALRHGFRDSFVDVELDLWHALEAGGRGRLAPLSAPA